MKRVRVTIELDEHFVRLLNAKCQIKQWTSLDEQPRMDPAGVLAVVVLGEARGALEEQIHAMTPIEWRPHIDVVHDRREVLEAKNR